MKSLQNYINESFDDNLINNINEGLFKDKDLDTMYFGNRNMARKKVKASDTLDFSVGKHLFLDDSSIGKYEIKFYRGSMHITNLEFAGKTGKRCTEYRISSFDDDYDIAISNYLMGGVKEATIGDLFYDFIFELLPNNKDGQYITTEITQDGRMVDPKVEKTITINMTVGSVKGIDKFSPFAIKDIKKLTKLPKKMNRAALIKAIANGQYVVLREKFRFTDDYVYDAHYKPTDNLDPFYMLEELFESSYGLSVWEQNDNVSNPTDRLRGYTFQRFSNESFEIVIDLDSKRTAKDIQNSLKKK